MHELAGCSCGRGIKDMDRVLFSSAKCEWETPQDLFNKLNEEFHFTVDVCALPENAKCEKYFTPEMDGLAQCWEGVCWCNPPYGREIGKWVIKAKMAQSTGATVVMLVPARTDTRWFHNYVYNGWNTEIRFLKERLKFGGGAERSSVPFDDRNIQAVR